MEKLREAKTNYPSPYKTISDTYICMYIYIDFLGLKKLFESVPGNSTTVNTPKRHFLKALYGVWVFYMGQRYGLYRWLNE